jgi:uncharacterized protein YndB with AHSA1/START domain
MVLLAGTARGHDLPGRTLVPDIVMSCNMDADAETVYRAISTTDGVTGWFTGKAEVGEGVGSHHVLTFPGMPTPWDLRVEDTNAPRRLVLSVVVGPPPWEGTTMTYEIADRPEGGIVLNFDHNGFASVDGVREFTIGWSTKVLALKKYVETGEPDPFFGS